MMHMGPPLPPWPPGAILVLLPREDGVMCGDVVWIHPGDEEFEEAKRLQAAGWLIDDKTNLHRLRELARAAVRRRKGLTGKVIDMGKAKEAK